MGRRTDRGCFVLRTHSVRYENLLESGVLDPAKVTRSCLESACSVAGIMLTTQAVIYEKPQKGKKEQESF